ncbi:unnamed protein product [Brachionus calyciflorus]|uniref:Uncharacterized protein n=1 Tax=Brachionus calyciflorus TaxID=104777 RepID=A0A814C9Q0_9BILA|nr:unnamed protein product [Brachionus calyciflorus]
MKLIFLFINFYVQILSSHSMDDQDFEYFDEDPNDLSLNKLKNLCKIYINDVEIKINEIESAQFLRAYYQDDISFLCEIPDRFEVESYDWSVNNLQLSLNEPEYSIKFDKKIDAETFLNVTCLFWLSGHGLPNYFEFPTILLEKYVFDPHLNHTDYLQLKYKKQIGMAKNGFYMIGTMSGILLIASLLFKYIFGDKF